MPEVTELWILNTHVTVLLFIIVENIQYNIFAKKINKIITTKVSDPY